MGTVAAPSTKWTIADYHRMITAGVLNNRQVELIDGDVVDMSPELPIHQATYRRSEKSLAQALGDRAVIFTAAPITLPENSEPQPDICIAMPPESRYDQRHPTPTDIYWLIEVANSTRDYDLGPKAQLYAQHQIREYWVIDIPQQRLWLHRQPLPPGYQSVVHVNSGTVAPLAFPDVRLEVARWLN